MGVCVVRIEGSRGRGQPKMTLEDVFHKDRGKFGLVLADVSDRCMRRGKQRSFIK